MKTNTLKAGTVDVTLQTSVRRTDALRNAAPSVDRLGEVDRRIDVISGFMARNPDNALMIIDHILKAKI